MSSGDPILEIIQVCPPASSAAGLRFVEGASAPAELVPLWLFDDTAAEYVDFLCRLSERYGGGGLSLVLPWTARSTAGGTNQVRWEAAVRRLADDAEDFDSTPQTYDYNGASDLPASAIGELSYPLILFANGADMDHAAAGELFILRVRRNPAHIDDTMPGDAELWGISGRET